MAKTLITSFLCASLLAVGLAGGAGAEIICALGPGASSYDANADQRPSTDAMELAKRMNAALKFTCSPKCPQIAVFRNTTAANAMLVVTADQAKFLYAPQFFAAVHDNYGDGAIVAIIAHEYGHALDEVYPAKWMNSGWSPELRADAWAGCALAKSGLTSNSLKEALIGVSKYPPVPPPHTGAPPNWTQRLPALRLGYIHCGGDSSKFDNAGR